MMQTPKREGPVNEPPVVPVYVVVLLVLIVVGGAFLFGGCMAVLSIH